jgi:hypothetical protein
VAIAAVAQPALAQVHLLLLDAAGANCKRTCKTNPLMMCLACYRQMAFQRF